MDRDVILQKAKDYAASETNPVFRDPIQALIEKNNVEELNEYFYSDLGFGTGGLRGIIGGGSNRMNTYNVKKATQGFANYVNKAITGKQPVAVIAYDSRNYSDTFAEDAALVFCANGIKTYLFSALRPTPELSYAVRYLKADAGIVVTASHNPPEYNGYKVYWNDGGQVVAPHDTGIIEEVKKVTTDVKSLSKEDAIEKGLLEIIDEKVDKPYIEMIKKLSIRPELLKEKGKDLKIVYTPLHGTGAFLVEKILGEMGIEVITVPEQREPDGDFPTVDFPNPEIAPAMKMAIELAKKEKADLVMGTDPDSDRLGIAVPEGDEYRLISGNQLGALLADYIFSGMKEIGTLPAKPAFINTIVTTDLQIKIAESYGAECYKVLTGFKFIADKIKEFETDGQGTEYVFGGEESYGFLIGPEVRDKDAISAAFMTAEMALYIVEQGKTVIDQLNSIYDTFGYYEETLISQYFQGQSGLETMKKMMEDMRADSPKTIGGIKVAEMKDYRDGTTKTIADGSVNKDIDLPSSNVLQFLLEDGSIVTARPSGTEPKIKFYASCCAAIGTEHNEAVKIVSDKMKAIEADLKSMIPE